MNLTYAAELHSQKHRPTIMMWMGLFSAVATIIQAGKEFSAICKYDYCKYHIEGTIISPESLSQDNASARTSFVTTFDSNSVTLWWDYITPVPSFDRVSVEFSIETYGNTQFPIETRDILSEQRLILQNLAMFL